MLCNKKLLNLLHQNIGEHIAESAGQLSVLEVSYLKKVQQAAKYLTKLKDDPVEFMLPIVHTGAESAFKWAEQCLESLKGLVGDASTSGTVASAAVPTAKVPLQQNRSAVSGSEKAGEVPSAALTSKKRSVDEQAGNPAHKHCNPLLLCLVDFHMQRVLNLVKNEPEVIVALELLQASMEITDGGANSTVLSWHLDQVRSLAMEDERISREINILCDCITYKYDMS